MKNRVFDLEDRLIDFAIQVDEIIEILPNTKLANHTGSQMIRSCTSPALNYGEAQSAESSKDFVHKLKIILKELRETRVGIKIITKKELVPIEKVNPAFDENNQLIAIFLKSIETAIKNMNR
jgi:four helix bundle protein